VHGPLAAIAVTALLLVENRYLAADFDSWQVFIFFTIVVFFASPTHADLRVLLCVARRSAGGSSGSPGPTRAICAHENQKLSASHDEPAQQAPLPRDLRQRAALVFLTGSVIFKVDRLLLQIGASADLAAEARSADLGLRRRRGRVLGAMIMSALTAQEVLALGQEADRGDVEGRARKPRRSPRDHVDRRVRELLRGLQPSWSEAPREPILEMTRSIMRVYLDVKLPRRIMRATTGAARRGPTRARPLQTKKTDEVFLALRPRG